MFLLTGFLSQAAEAADNGGLSYSQKLVVLQSKLCCEMRRIESYEELCMFLVRPDSDFLPGG